jgi:predicted polyphosphate/ATP-dependent NAD kinase
MGAQVLAGLDLTVEVLDGAAPSETRPADTRRAAAALTARDVAAVLFAGGDGTARDLTDTLGLDTPMLGIPCGVKMHSGVFATSPEAAGRLAADLLRAGDARVGLRRVEIMDIDEDAARAGRIAARLYGYARAPHAANLLQGSKAGPRISDEAMLAGACAEIAGELAPGVLYLVGPGTSAKGVLTALGLEGTLLGVDALRDGRLVWRDLSEADAMALAGDGPICVIVGITGGQGFVFGRGNQQIGPEAIRRAGRERLIIVAGVAKLAALPAARLLVDTGDAALDAALDGHVRVRTGPRQAMLMRLTA